MEYFKNLNARTNQNIRYNLHKKIQSYFIVKCSFKGDIIHDRNNKFKKF